MSNDPRIILTENVVHSATSLGIHVVKEIVKATLVQHPNISLAEFVHILDESAHQAESAMHKVD